MRGEYQDKTQIYFVASGSPPHAWRIHLGAGEVNKGSRITSTCVENTHRWIKTASRHQDHLHMRGEYS